MKAVKAINGSQNVNINDDSLTLEPDFNSNVRAINFKGSPQYQWRANNPDQFTALEYGQAIGIAPAIAAYNIQVRKDYIIMSTQLLRAMIMGHGQCHNISVIDDNGEITVSIVRKSYSYKASFSHQEALQMGITKRVAWKMDPQAVCEEYALFRVARKAFPELVFSALSPSEAEDVEESKGFLRRFFERFFSK